MNDNALKDHATVARRIARNTTHEYRCIECGVTFKGRANARGEVRATNAPPSGEQRTCVCVTCKAVQP